MGDHLAQGWPLVSVIIPVHNAALYLETALASIYRQEYTPLEIIVVDDGSTDETVAIAARHPAVTILRQSNQGPASARNSGLQASRGELIAFLDADDFWAPAMLPRLVAHLQQHPHVEIVQGLIQRMAATWQDDEAGQRRLILRPQYAPHPYVNLGSGVYRRQVFERVGYFAAELGPGLNNEDTDWMIRAWEMAVKKEVIPQIFLYYVVRSDSLTAGGTRNSVTLMHLLKRHRDRVRRGEVVAPHGAEGALRLYGFLGTAPPHGLEDGAASG